MIDAVDILNDVINELKAKIDKAKKKADGLKFGEHNCSEKMYPNSCTLCEHNNDMDELIKGLDKE